MTSALSLKSINEQNSKKLFRLTNDRVNTPSDCDVNVDGFVVALGAKSRTTHINLVANANNDE